MIDTWQTQNIFETYLMMGPGRTIKGLSEATGIKLTTLANWRRRLGWNARLEEKDRQAIEALQKETDVLYKDTVIKRHQDAYKKIQEKSLKQLERKKLNFESDKDAAIALDIGIKGERQILGFNNSTIKGKVVGEGFAAMVEAVLIGTGG